MPSRKPKSEAPLAGRRGDLDAVGPLALDAATVASEGIVRAALDAVAAHPATARSAASARAAGREAMERHVTATASLARRSAETYARSVAALVKPDPTKPAVTPPPF